MRTALRHLEMPPEVAGSTSDLLDALTLIGLAGDELSRMALRRLARRPRSTRNQGRLDRLAAQNARLDQLAMLCREVACLHVAGASRRPHDGLRVPPPPVGRPDSDLALAHLEAWWTSCVPALLDTARASATRIAEELVENSSAAGLELADRLTRFAAAEHDALTS